MVRLGLIGASLGHSFSAEYFSRKFSEEGIEGEYKLYELPTPEAIGSFIAGHPDLTGFNVTVPYKEAVMDHLDLLDAAAEEIGAVNTVKVLHTDDGRRLLKGYNTDWAAFRDSLVPLLAQPVGKALVAGTGGAAKAVGYALRSLGIDPLFISRKPNETAVAAIGYEDLTPEIMAGHLMVVNATPIGMWPAVDSMPPLPYHLITDRHICYDLIYNPAETAFMREAAARGAAVKNGLEMLHRQADLAWNIWTNKD